MRMIMLDFGIPFVVMSVRDVHPTTRLEQAYLPFVIPFLGVD